MGEDKGTVDRPEEADSRSCWARVKDKLEGITITGRQARRPSTLLSLLSLESKIDLKHGHIFVIPIVNLLTSRLSGCYLPKQEEEGEGLYERYRMNGQ